MCKILNNKQNLITLFTYRKKAKDECQLELMNVIIDKFSRDFNITNLLKSLRIEQNFLECLILDLEKE